MSSRNIGLEPFWGGGHVREFCFKVRRNYLICWVFFNIGNSFGGKRLRLYVKAFRTYHWNGVPPRPLFYSPWKSTRFGSRAYFPRGQINNVETLKGPHGTRRFLRPNAAHCHGLLLICDALCMERMAAAQQLSLAWLTSSLHCVCCLHVSSITTEGRAFYSLPERGLDLAHLEQQTLPSHPFSLVEPVVAATDPCLRPDHNVPLPCLLLLMRSHAG